MFWWGAGVRWPQPLSGDTCGGDKEDELKGDVFLEHRVKIIICH